MEKNQLFSSLAGLQIAPDKNKQSVFTALIRVHFNTSALPCQQE